MSDTVINRNIVVGDVFIVPNSLCALSEMAPSARERIKRDLARLSVYGLLDRVKEDEPLVQLWFTNKDCDNWLDHHWEGMPFYGGKENQYAGLAAYWPVRALMGIEEGDTFKARMVDYKGEEWELILTPNQEGYRYLHHGSFGKVLRDLLARFYTRALQPWPAA